MNFTCHSCGFTKNISSKYAGKKVRCPKCSELVKCNEVIGKNRFEEIEIKKASGSTRVAEDKSHEQKAYTIKEYIEKFHSNENLDQLEGVQMLDLYLHEGVRVFDVDIINSEGEVKKAKDNVLNGRGKVQIARSGQMLSQILLNQDSIYISSNALIACSSQLKIEEKDLNKESVKKIYKISGKGVVTLASFGKPRVISNAGEEIANAKLEATLFWTSGLKYNVGANMTFQGEGFVFTQPYSIKKAEKKILKPINEEPSDKKYKIIAAVASLAFVVMSALYFLQPPTLTNSNRTVANTQSATDMLVDQINKKQFELKGQKVRLKRMGLKATEADREQIRNLENEISELQKKL